MPGDGRVRAGLTPPPRAFRQSGDIEGCTLDKNNNVKTPKGFKEAYAEYAAGGWQGMTVPEAYGGMGMPLSLGLIKSEMIGTANWSWGSTCRTRPSFWRPNKGGWLISPLPSLVYPGLSVGCMNTLILHGSEEQKQTYLTKLAEGSWLGTMCLTEPHCGTDLSQVPLVWGVSWFGRHARVLVLNFYLCVV